MQRPRRESDKIDKEGPSTEDLNHIFLQESPIRAPHKSFIQALLVNIFKIFSHGLSDKISPGSSQDLTQTSTRPWSRSTYYNDLWKCTVRLSQDRLRRTFQRLIENEHHRELSTVHKVTRRLCNRTTIWAIWHAQTDEQVARSMTKWAQNHNESDLTRTNDQRVARTQVRISPSTSTTMKSESWKCDRQCFAWLFAVSKIFHLPRNEPAASKVQQLPKMMKCQCQTKKCHKTFPTFQNTPQNHPLLRLPRKMTSETTSHFLPRVPFRFGNVHKVLSLPCRWKSVRCPKSDESLAPVTKNVHAPKTDTACTRERMSPGPHFARDFLWKRKIEELLRWNGTKLAGHRCDLLRPTPGLD